MMLLAVFLLGFALGSVGIFLLFRRESMVGDAVAHAAFPGISLMFLYMQTRSVFLLLLGGNISGIFALLLLLFFSKTTALKKETILGILLSVFFGIGLVIVTIIQKRNIASQAIINKLLFGNAATLLAQEIYIIILVCSLVLFLLFLSSRLLITATFDPIFAKSCGYSLFVYEMLLYLLIISLIALSLQVVGVVLTSSMLIAPGASARQWVNSPYVCLLIAGFFGAFSAMLGTIVSMYFNYAPTGPLIIIILSFFVFFSLIFTSKRNFL